MWYAAKLLFKSSIVHDDGRFFQEESLRLIRAGDEVEAQLKANNLGVNEQHQYTNSDGEIVRWQFDSVLEVQDLCEETLFDGMEVFSELKWKDAAIVSQHTRG